MQYNQQELITIDKIKVNDNLRKKFNDNEIKELAESIKNVGLINPLTVAENKEDDETYILIAGERRYRACKLIKMVNIPCIVVEGNEMEMRKLQLIENCQRKEINPIEELEAFAELVSKGFEPQDIADNINKSKQYVYQRLNLIKLNDRAKMLLFDDMLNMAQCRYLALMDEELQEKALDELIYSDGMDNLKFKSAEAFRKFYMSKRTKSLLKVPWDLDDSKLYKSAGPCISCKFNSAVNKMLFEEMSIDGFCSNTECYDKKAILFAMNKVKEFEDSGITVVQVSEYYDEKLSSVMDFTKATEKDFFNYNMNPEKAIVVVKGNNRIGEFHYVFTKKQLKEISKKDSLKNKKVEDKKKLAIDRFKDLTISKIAQNITENGFLFSEGVINMAVYKLFTQLDKNDQISFIELISGQKIVKSDLGSNGKKAFFSNYEHIESKIEYAMAILCIIDLNRDFIHKEVPEFVLFQKLAKEANVDIMECKQIVSEETGIDLDEV